MTSLAVSHSFECAPRAVRSGAMALTLALNLTIVLFALRPSTPYTIHSPTPQALLASILPPPPPVTRLPTVPTVRMAPHVVAPGFHLAIARAAPIALPALSAIAPVAPVQSVAPSGTHAVAAAGDSNATIAYATATPPRYPTRAVAAGIEGTVVLKVLVDPDGKPVKVMVAHSSGSRLLDEAALRHVLATWRFHPATHDGRAIEAWALVPVRFNLNRD
ncbi:MAG TPA: energy transducer TonB [Rhodanobacteraceae bacterium]|nr:energy transducer TonB [Rhodanobacteraceae bacterium]